MKLAAKSAIAALLVGGTATAGLAMADTEDARALADAKITLTEAIEAAEAHTNGKAYEAQIEDDSFSPEFEVGIVADNTVYEVRVNGETGEVLSSREDHDD
ncbi:PepSY domain-containing protein [Henriciella aquimarina]|uniref:PepSY domain-containing protein n=1 Tax=Henriciella aquimarina TaxID=545261 RepID=UPI000A018755|nr:PepSY domain-containing protein [Henriciella aquimarina]